jgi:hypothetical protein
MPELCLLIEHQDTAVHRGWGSTWSGLVCGQSRRPDGAEVKTDAAAADAAVNPAVILASKGTQM